LVAVARALRVGRMAARPTRDARRSRVTHAVTRSGPSLTLEEAPAARPRVRGPAATRRAPGLDVHPGATHL